MHGGKGMASRQSTIIRARQARTLHNRGISNGSIASQLGVSEKRIEEYLERNNHPTSCQICGGYGINKKRDTGKKTAICA